MHKKVKGQRSEVKGGRKSKEISFEKFLSRIPRLTEWANNPAGFALVETASAFSRESYPLGQYLATSDSRERFDEPTGWFFDSHEELCFTLSAKFLIFAHGEKFTTKRWEAVRQVLDIGQKPVLVLFAPGSIRKLLTDPWFKQIVHRAVFVHSAR